MPNEVNATLASASNASGKPNRFISISLVETLGLVALVLLMVVIALLLAIDPSALSELGAKLASPLAVGVLAWVFISGRHRQRQIDELNLVTDLNQRLAKVAEDMSARLES